MIVVDTNIFVYAHRQDSNDHVRAASSIMRLAEGSAPWATGWHTFREFFSTVTNSRIFPAPTTPADALRQIDYWLESPSLVLLRENDAYRYALWEFLRTSRVTGPRVHDAHVAALCISHGVQELWTADRDFSRFPALRVRNPLVES